MERDPPCLDIKDDGRKRGTNCSDDDGGADRISALPDDVLLDILQCVDLRTAVRAGAVARRWRHLPCMLPDLDMDIATLVPHRRWWFSVDCVMAMYTNSVLWFLVPTRHRTSLRLAFYLVEVDPCLRSIGDAITATPTDRLELTLRTAYDVEFGEYSRRFASFLAAFPTAFARLTNITLHDFVFTTSSEIAGLLDACHGLELLSLTKCRWMDSAVEKFEINAPSSSLLALELHDCFFHGVELTRLPKLERLLCDHFTFVVESMRFSCVPFLRAINISAQHLQCYFDNPASLSPAFNNLRDVSLCNMDILDMAWIISVLDAAPFLSDLSIKLNHRCFTHEGPYKFILAGERPKFEHHNLSSLEIKSYGISKDMDVMDYIRLIRTHAVCLKRIHLLEQCEYTGCDGVTCLGQVEEEGKKILRDILNLGFSTSVEITIEPMHSKRKLMEQVTPVC